jgi:ribose transport system permease protein
MLKRISKKIDPAILIVAGLLMLILLVGSVFTQRFGTMQNFANVLEQCVSLGFVSLGQSIVVLTGGIDLSIGSLINLTSCLTSGMIDGRSGMVIPVVLGVLFLGLMIGGVNGLLTVSLGVHPLIVTLGMMSILQGITLIYTLRPPGSMPLFFDYFAYGRILGFPFGTLVMLILFALVMLFLKRVKQGRYIYAVGGSVEAARLSGISVNRILILAYALCGSFASLTGVYLVSRMGMGDPWMGQGYELASITPVVVGGITLAGGKGGLPGVLLGVFLMSFLNNLLNFMDVSSFYQWIVQGIIIVVAVSFYTEKIRK